MKNAPTDPLTAIAPKILVVSGTDRPGSRTVMLARQMQDTLATMGADASLLDLACLPPNWFAPSAYANRKDPDRPEVRPWMAAHGLLVVVPEYNGSFPGALKHFIDLLPFPEALADKAVAFIGLAAGQWGGLNAVSHLQAIFSNRRSFVFPEHVLIPGADEEIAEGVVTPTYAERLARQSAGFLKFVKQVNQA